MVLFMVSLKKLASKLLRGQYNTAVFALTTKCNCKCIMCGMHKNPPELMEFEDVKKVLKFLAENKFIVVYFTGGEPTLHPNIVEIVEFADRLGLATSLTTNGTLTKNQLKGLKDAGLMLLSVSIDHWNPEICEKIRGVKGIMQKQEEAILYAKKIGLKVYALVYINPWLVVDGIEKIIDYVNFNLGAPIGFCYPTQSEVNTFKLYGDFYNNELNKKLRDSIEKILRLKKLGYNILNVGTYLEDILSLNKTRNFYCKGGENVFYIDWHGDVYPCFLRGKLFNIFKDKPKILRNVKCDDCFINCFREPSLLPQIFRSPKLLVKEAMYFFKVKNMII